MYGYSLHWVSQAEADKQSNKEKFRSSEGGDMECPHLWDLTQMIHADKSPAVSVSIYGLWV